MGYNKNISDRLAGLRQMFSDSDREIDKIADLQILRDPKIVKNSKEARRASLKARKEREIDQAYRQSCLSPMGRYKTSHEPPETVKPKGIAELKTAVKTVEVKAKAVKGGGGRTIKVIKLTKRV